MPDGISFYFSQFVPCVDYAEKTEHTPRVDMVSFWLALSLDNTYDVDYFHFTRKETEVLKCESNFSKDSSN